jgi:hypothetical protein
MNEGAFQGYVKTFPGSDPSLGALQCYVQSSGTIDRHTQTPSGCASMT